MGAHPDHALHKVFHQWRKRAREAEAKLALVQRVLDEPEWDSYTRRQIQTILNTGKDPEHDQC